MDGSGGRETGCTCSDLRRPDVAGRGTEQERTAIQLVTLKVFLTSSTVSYGWIKKQLYKNVNTINSVHSAALPLVFCGYLAVDATVVYDEAT